MLKVRRSSNSSLVKLTVLIGLAVATPLSANIAAAKGGGNGGFGGASSSHVGSQAITNSNGPNSPDRDFGQDRAADRGNAHKKPNLNSNGVNAVDRDFGKDRARDRHLR